MIGIYQSIEWQEWPEASFNVRSDKKFGEGRFALNLALSSLPLSERGFFSFEDFEQALFERIGLVFSLKYFANKPSTYRRSQEESTQLLNKWFRKVRQNWERREKPWFSRVLCTWLYFLGIVELVLQDKTLLALRPSMSRRRTK